MDSAVKKCWKTRCADVARLKQKIQWGENVLFIELVLHVCWFQSVVTLDGNKLIHVQKWDDKETELVREVNGNNLTLVSTASASYISELIVCLLMIFAVWRLY